MKKMTTGIESFKEMVEEDIYYVDKTQFIENVMEDKVTLYTRPRRFGKTLNMSMLYYFFSDKEDSRELFKGLKITENAKAMTHMNQYPVISITLSDLNASTMSEQLEFYASIIARVVKQHDYLFDSKELRESDLKILSEYEFKMSKPSDLRNALFNLTYWISKATHKKVMILIDEYDVPLNYAYEKGYYDEMVEFISGAFSSVLKSNPYLEKGVLTGCLRVARESIFTGLNNLRTCSVIDEDANEFFGFTQDELEGMLDYYSLLEKRDVIKEWYDGYNFGGVKLYNPWSATKYAQALIKHRKNHGNTDKEPEPYWSNTSHNGIVYNYIKNGNKELKEEFKKLVDGETITRELALDLTYRDMDDIDHIYSFLLFTGYLNIVSPVYDEDGIRIRNTYQLSIPNKEVGEIYEDAFIKWFNGTYENVNSQLIQSLINQDVERANRFLNDFLFKTISYYDYSEEKYHGLLLGLLNHDGYRACSNKESGLGRYDLFVSKETVDPLNSLSSPCILIEVKKTDTREILYDSALEGINQIRERKYIEGKQEEGYKNIKAYSIAFYKKNCLILSIK